jgi:hypothetical protein
MPRYEVLRDLNIMGIGLLRAGEVVDLPRNVARWVNHIAPGTIKEAGPQKRQTKKPPQDRMVRGSDDRGVQDDSA